MNTRPILVAIIAMVFLCAHAIAQPNNNCQFAQPIVGDGLFNFDNGGATADGFPDPCGKIDSDVWFVWTAEGEGLVNLHTCGLTPVDTKISVLFAGPCPAGNGPVACNDDACGPQSVVAWPATAGETFFIRIGTPPGVPGGPGAFEIFTEGGPDCNGNGVPDDQDIADGTSLDNNANGQPDECETTVAFEQVSWKDEFGGFAQQFSDFGTLKVTAVQPATGEILWINAIVDGNWVVQNAPLVTMTSIGDFHLFEVGFDLRNIPGDAVATVDAIVTVTSDQSATGPVGPLVTYPVAEAPQHIGLRVPDGGVPAAIVPTDPLDFINPFSLVIWETISRPDVPGVQEENNHCAPGSVSRSLAWMNDEYCLGFPADCDSTSEIYDTLKDAMHMMTSAVSGTTDPKIVSGTQQIIIDKGLAGSLTVTLDLNKTPADAFDALQQGKDVMGLICYTGRGGHIYTITGVTRCLGEYTIHYRDDEDQGDPSDGDEGTKDSKYDSGTGTLSGFGAGANWDGLVIICPSLTTQFDAMNKWLTGAGDVSGAIAALDAAIMTLTDGGTLTPEQVADMLHQVCNAADTSCSMLANLQQASAPATTLAAAERLKDGAGAAKIFAELFKLSYLFGSPNVGLLQAARDSLGDPADNIATVQAYLDCPADRDRDGDVDVDDLVTVITNWGCTTPPCTGDVNGDGTTNVDDLVEVITTWGPCP